MEFVSLTPEGKIGLTLKHGMYTYNELKFETRLSDGWLTVKLEKLESIITYNNNGTATISNHKRVRRRQQLQDTLLNNIEFLAGNGTLLAKMQLQLTIAQPQETTGAVQALCLETNGQWQAVT